VCTGFLWGELRERDNLEILGVDGRVVLKFILKNWGVEMELIVWLRRGRDWSFCECGDEPSVCIKCGEKLIMTSCFHILHNTLATAKQKEQ